MPSILVTGANRGLGLEFVRQYAADGWTVYACCRKPNEAEDLNAIADASGGRVTLHALNIGDHATINTLAEDLEGHSIDILLNNAGTYGERGFADGGMDAQAFGSMDYANWASVFAINTMAPLKMCEAFVDNVAASDQKKMITISSIMGSIAEPPGGGHLTYGSTKAAVNYVMSSLAIALKDRGITVMSLHPGWVQTDMGSAAAPVTPEQSINGLKKVMAETSLASSGTFVGYDGKAVRW